MLDHEIEEVLKVITNRPADQLEKPNWDTVNTLGLSCLQKMELDQYFLFSRGFEKDRRSICFYPMVPIIWTWNGRRKFRANGAEVIVKEIADFSRI